jgi:hypothetical protein
MPVARRLEGAGMLPPTSALGRVSPFIDACHGLPKSRTNEGKKSPQSVLRSSISPQLKGSNGIFRSLSVTAGAIKVQLKTS